MISDRVLEDNSGMTLQKGQGSPAIAAGFHGEEEFPERIMMKSIPVGRL